MKRMILIASALLTLHTPMSVPADSLAVPPQWRPGWSDYTTATAAAYCLAKHPYFTEYSEAFTPEGYEIARAPGVVGAVRRNFVYSRTTSGSDEGQGQSCEQACRQFGMRYSPLTGHALQQRVGSDLRSSGIGDIAAEVLTDNDYYLGTSVIAGIWSRANTWHESDVAQADLCCCQVTYD
jgi:hypothetical protein